MSAPGSSRDMPLRPQLVVAQSGRRVLGVVATAVLCIVAAILLAPFIFAAVFVGAVSDKAGAVAQNGVILRAERSGPGEVQLRATAVPSAAMSAATPPAMRWPVEALAGVTALHTLAQKSGDVREDRWAFGAPSGSGPFAGLTFLQGDTSRYHRSGFLAEALSAVRVNADARLAGPAYTFDTRFGRFNGRDVLINDGVRGRTCIGFVSALDLPYAMVSGVYCDAPGRSAGPGAVACMIDRIRFERAELAPALAVLAEKSASGAPQCQSQSFHEPGTRRNVYDSRGRTVGLR